MINNINFFRVPQACPTAILATAVRAQKKGALNWVNFHTIRKRVRIGHRVPRAQRTKIVRTITRVLKGRVKNHASWHNPISNGGNPRKINHRVIASMEILPSEGGANIPIRDDPLLRRVSPTCLPLNMTQTRGGAKSHRNTVPTWRRIGIPPKKNATCLLSSGWANFFSAKPFFAASRVLEMCFPKILEGMASTFTGLAKGWVSIGTSFKQLFQTVRPKVPEPTNCS